MNTAKEFSYPVLAVTDLANNYSPEHFRFAIGHCRDVIAKIIAEDNRSDQQIARVRILRYLDIQLSRAVRWIEEDVRAKTAIAAGNLPARGAVWKWRLSNRRN